MAERNIQTEYVYGIRFDTSDLESDMKTIRKKIDETLAPGVKVNPNTISGDKHSQYYRRDYMGDLAKGAGFDRTAINVLQEIADNTAAIAYKLGVDDQTLLNLASSRQSDYVSKDKAKKEEDKAIATNDQQDFSKVFALFKSNAVKAAAGLGVLYKAIKQFYDAGMTLLNTMSEASNKFVSSSSMFVDRNTRNTMARYGVGSIEAQALNMGMSKLGISSEDLAILTQGQRDALKQLMKVYQEGIEGIDTEKLEKYNSEIQRYEMIRAEFDIKREVAITKLFANAAGLDGLIDSFGDFLDNVVELLESPGAQAAMDMFIGFLTSLMDILSSLADLGGLILGKTANNLSSSASRGSTTNYVNVYGSSYANTNNYALAAEIQRALM